MFDLLKKVFASELVRFLIGGAINTLMGGILLPYLYEQIFGLQILFVFLGTKTYVSLLVGYLIWFSFAYLIQIKFVFRSRFVLKRFIAYPFTQIPNFLINNLFLHFFRNILVWPSLISFCLAAILTVPIMFVLVRFVVKAKEVGKKEKLKD